MSNIKPIALYVHWPFCKAKCPYCDFNSHVREGVDAGAWRQALLTELRHTVGLLAGPRVVTSIFFGGGTPSLMAPETVGAIIDEAAKLWGLDPACEITLEANPTSVEAEKFEGFRAAGVNRVSIGVQSLVADDLKALGRMHSVEEARAAVALAARIFPRYSFDLIYARPNQTPSQWEAELREAMGMMGDHLSVYQLTIEPNTQFHTLYHSGRLVIPDEDNAAVFYDITQTLLGNAGMPAYEVSNHARAGCESRHNLTYWRYGEYAGIGPGAHGRLFVTPNGVAATPTLRRSGAPLLVATRTHRAPEEWLKRVAENGNGYHPHEAIDERAAFEEKLMMGLRLSEGVALEGLNPAWLNAKKITALRKEGLLEDTDARLVPTTKGRLVLTSLNAALLAA
ncbi:MAG: coproporphyrinogen III oxidase [Alphaproteobacteria bacterium]|nr:coproporphyrinogen III oxidase [Alphaproteobacteria bacterium]